MGWRILVFYPEWKRGVKFTNILPTMLKLTTQYGLYEVILFWYV